MKRTQRLLRLAVLSVVTLVVPTVGWAGWTWSNITPANGAQNVPNGSSVDIAATVKGSPEVPSGTVLDDAPSGTTTNVSYHYNWRMGRGDFEPEQVGMGSATVSFSPAIASGTSVTVTFRASGNNSAGQHTTSYPTTFTVQ